MKLLIVTQYFWPENFRINDLVLDMVRRGHEVTVLTGIPNYPTGRVFPEFRAAPDQFAVYAGARILRTPMFSRGKGSVQLILNYLSFVLGASLFGAWKLRGQAFDVIFVCQLSPVTSALPAIFLRHLKRVPLAMWVLDLWPETLSAIGALRSAWALGLVGRLVSFIYLCCDLILAQSRSFVPEIKKRIGEIRPVEYFPSWAESVFQREEIAPAAEVPIAHESFNVMFAGNIGDAQDFPAILTAAEILKPYPKIRWLIVGDGRAASWVAAEIERRNLSQQVLMLGQYPVDRMPEFFQHAHAMLVTLRDAPIFAMTIPGKMQAFLAAGIPVVAMLNGEGARVIEESGAGLTCAAGDSESLAKAVLALHEMLPAERLSMGLRGKEMYQQEFSREHLLDKLESWLTTLAVAR